MPSTAVNAQGTTVQIGTGSGSAQTVTAIALGFPTILTIAAHGRLNGDYGILAGFTGADAALLNGQSATVVNKTTNTFAVNIDTTGKTVTVGAGTFTSQTFALVGNLKGFNGPDGSANEIDVSNMDSTAKEIVMGLPDGGSVSLDLDSDDANAGQAAAYAAWQSRAQKSIKINMSNGKVMSFQAYVKKFARTGAVDAPLKTTVDLRITGAVTLA